LVQQRLSSVSREPLALQEFALLMADPVFYGVGVPRGDGRPALVLPGLFANDFYLQPMHSWLGRIGYRPVPSTFWVNAGCPERLTGQAQEALERRLSRSERPAVIIGHSRGGILAKAIATRLSERASHLVLLGSPVGAMMRYNWGDARNAPTAASRTLGEASSRIRNLLDPDCDAPGCGCAFFADLRAPLNRSTKVVSIYSRDDPIVPAWSCQIPGAENIEVSGTHSGLAFNGAVYRALAEQLNSG
jgi:triacylglycerol lipase